MEQNYKHRILSALSRYCDCVESHTYTTWAMCRAEEQIETFLLENAILQAFGLPDKAKNHLILYNLAKSNRLQEKKEEKVFYELSVRAEEYLSSRPKTIRQLLAMAKENKSDPFDILPELSVNSNSYTLYIYNEILLKSKASDEEILEEFNLLKKMNCLSYIYLLSFDPNYMKNPLFAELQQSGLKYLLPYLKYYHSRRHRHKMKN